MINFDSLPFQYLIPFSRPSSFDALPPIHIPAESEVARVERLKQSLIRDCGIRPGNYARLQSGLHPKIVAVYDGLMKALLSELSGVDPFDLCIRLYERNEEYLGYLFMAHFDVAARREILGSSESSIHVERLWERLSPYTESIRWLIEITLKHCERQGHRAGADKFDRLIELARALFEWDLNWEQIHRNVTQHHLMVGSDFSATPQLTRWTAKVRREYQQALMPTMAENEREDFERFQNRLNRLTAQEALGNTVEALKSMGLDEALLEDRGYSLSDWGKFSLGLLDSFDKDEYRRVRKLNNVESFLSRNWNLDPQRMPYLLRDFGLSRETVQEIGTRQLRPVEHGRRDSRLLRRPVVVLERNGSIRCLYGVETVSSGLRLLLRRLESGRIDLVRQSNNRSLRKAVGRLQKELGGVFEQNIAEECRVRGYEFRREKDRVKGNKIPQGSNFGPVDVFIIDRTHRRFVLVEAKNVASEGSLPKEMQNERNDFSKFIDKLNLQVEWFAQQLADLKSENGVPEDETYSVEGVIVVNGPKLWMFTYDRPIPIVDFFNFFRCLEQGKNFAISPVNA